MGGLIFNITCRSLLVNKPVQLFNMDDYKDFEPKEVKKEMVVESEVETESDSSGEYGDIVNSDHEPVSYVKVPIIRERKEVTRKWRKPMEIDKLKDPKNLENFLEDFEAVSAVIESEEEKKIYLQLHISNEIRNSVRASINRKRDRLQKIIKALEEECGVKEQKRISRQKLREYKWNRSRESIYEYGNTIKTLCATARYFDKEDVHGYFIAGLPEGEEKKVLRLLDMSEWSTYEL